MNLLKAEPVVDADSVFNRILFRLFWCIVAFLGFYMAYDLNTFQMYICFFITLAITISGGILDTLKLRRET